MRHIRGRGLCMSASLWLSLAIFAQGQVTAIRAGRLIDPEAGTALTNQVILVEGKTIRAVGPDLPIPPGAVVIDLSNATTLDLASAYTLGSGAIVDALPPGPFGAAMPPP